VKRTIAATLLVLTSFAASYAQDSARVAPSRAKSDAARTPRAKSPEAEESPKSGARFDEVDRLLDRSELAQGGVAAFAIKSRITRGRVEMSESPVAGSFESYEKEPDKKMNILNTPGGQFIQAADGGRSWEQSPWGFAARLRGEDDSKGGGARGPKWRKYFSAASVRGRAVVDGRETVELDATPKGGHPVRMYFDAETWLLRKQEFTAHAPPQENELKAIYIDRYALVDGVSVPTVFRHVYTKYTLTFRIYEVKHNVPIDDALFRSPEGK
jgi:hypothetical protein